VTPVQWAVVLVMIGAFALGIYLDIQNNDRNGPRPL
jgi:hypothetical protein